MIYTIKTNNNPVKVIIDIETIGGKRKIIIGQGLALLGASAAMAAASLCWRLVTGGLW